MTVNQPWMANLDDCVGFGLETTGVDVESDRVVTAAIITMAAGKPTETDRWLINPGIDIPEGATAVHGITTEHAQEHGQPPTEALAEIVHQLAEALARGLPVVGMNLSYDFTLLDRDCRRNGLVTLTAQLGAMCGGDGAICPVIDIYEIDRWVDKYRRGKRQLEHLAAHYNVPQDAAHTAVGDVITALRIAWRMGSIATAGAEPGHTSSWQRLGAMSLRQLHEAQIVWARERATSYADYLRSRGKTSEADAVNGEWPLHSITP